MHGRGGGMKKENAFPNVVIRASAGTGKTYQLAVRFIGLLAAGARPDEILATTFTRKAAGEILDRVLSWLAVATTDTAKRAELSKKIDKPLSAEKCRELFITMVRRLHVLRVGTLDSHFLQVATSFGHELGLPPGWSICDELADWLLRDEAIELLLTRGKLADLLTLVHSLTKGAAPRAAAGLRRDTLTSLVEMAGDAAPGAWRQTKVGQGREGHEGLERLARLAAVPVVDQRMQAARTEDQQGFLAGGWDAFICKGP